MKKYTVASIIFTVICSLPYAFFALYVDKEWQMNWFYVIYLCLSAILGWPYRKIEKITKGKLCCVLSALLSIMFAQLCYSGEDSYFKPFGAVGWATILSFYSFMIQYLIWNFKRERDVIQNFFMSVFSVVLVFSGIILMILFTNAYLVGAI